MCVDNTALHVSGIGRVAYPQSCVFDTHINVDWLRLLCRHYVDKIIMWSFCNNLIQREKGNVIVCLELPGVAAFNS